MSKQSIKSKSQHLVANETIPFKLSTIQWEGNGIYVHNQTSQVYQKVTDMKDLEFKIASENYGPPILVRKNQFNELVWWGGMA